MPPSYDAVNLVLTPSKATFNVCAVPPPTDVILIAVLLAALEALVASFIVFLSFFITKYTVPFVNPPIFPPLPFVYVTLCPCTNL